MFNSYFVFLISESVPFLIIGIVVAISVIIAFIFIIYFCRCCKWSHDTNDIFKDVDKDIVVNYKEAVPVKPTANGKDIKDKVKLYCSEESHFTLPIAEILSGKNAGALVSMVLYFKIKKKN